CHRLFAVHSLHAVQRIFCCGQLPALFDEFGGHQRAVVDHRIEPLHQPLPGGVFRELHEQIDAFCGSGTVEVVTHSAHGDHAAYPFRMVDGETGCHHAAHRITDHVHRVQAECVEETWYCGPCGGHGVLTGRITDPEAREFQHQASEVFGERG